LPSALPAGALAPLNSTATPRATNPPGTYTMWLYVNDAVTVNGASVRGAANAIVDFQIGAGTITPRQVIARAACDSCHVVTQAHGGGRQDAEGCALCHTQGAVDRTVGAKGAACTATAQCGGGAAGWETCDDTNNDGKLDTCVITTDPTPNQTIDFGPLVHSIHYARVRGGFAERANLVDPGQLVVVGFNNSVNNFSDILFPQDIRNCTKCHADAGGTCSASAPCGIGQSCIGGTCKNVAWQVPSARICLSCHDEDDATGHAAIMTYTDPVTNERIETCGVCHGDGADFAVSKVHNISAPYKPPYARE
jgi:hypothetical protein